MKAQKTTKTKPIKLIKVKCCMECPFRRPFDTVVDGTVDECTRSKLTINYCAYSEKGEFPKKCPLPTL